jgi:S1-C subfamily serine protease
LPGRHHITNSGAIAAQVVGIEVANVSTFTGSISNNGTISALGTGIAVGGTISHVRPVSIFNGNIVNTVTVAAQFAISVHGSTMRGTLPAPHPAARANIEAGDVVTAVNGSPLGNWSDFIPTISAMAPGTDVYLTTYRDEQLIEVKVTIGSFKCPRN